MADKLDDLKLSIRAIICKHCDANKVDGVRLVCLVRDRCTQGIIEAEETIALFTQHIREGGEVAAEGIRDIVYMRDAIDAWTNHNIEIVKNFGKSMPPLEITPAMVQHRGVGERRITRHILSAMGVQDEGEKV